MIDNSRPSDPSNADDSSAAEAVTREQLMIAMRKQGATLSVIGREFGVSRERVRQIIQASGGPSPAEMRTAALARAATQEGELRVQVETSLRRILESSGALSGEEAANSLGIDEAQVLKFWPADMAHLRIRPASGTARTWTDEQILDCVRAAAVYEFPLTAKAYAELVRVGEVRGPSLPRVNQRFGSWAAACELAGVEPGQTLRAVYESRWTDAELLAFIRDYLVDADWPNSAKKFDEWRREVSPDAPSFQTIRNRLGTWSNAKRLALRPVEGNE